MIKFVKCPHCGNSQKMEIDTTLEKFDSKEVEILQNECLKLFKRIEKLRYKHDYENLTNYQLYDVNLKISALTKIENVLEKCL